MTTRVVLELSRHRCSTRHQLFVALGSIVSICITIAAAGDDPSAATTADQAPENVNSQWAILQERGWAGIETAIRSENPKLHALAERWIKNNGPRSFESIFIMLVKSQEHRVRNRINRACRGSIAVTRMHSSRHYEN